MHTLQLDGRRRRRCRHGNERVSLRRAPRRRRPRCAALLAKIAASNTGPLPLRAVVLLADRSALEDEAAAADARWASRAPRSPFDGVPLLIKDEIDVRDVPTFGGTSFLGDDDDAARHAAFAQTVDHTQTDDHQRQRRRRVEDAECCRRLRAAGALLVGKTNMHEIGIGVSGINTNARTHGVCRNPHDRRFDTSGSSSGSGAAVAAGLVPVALGADGGGSVRLPAAFCGCVGLKPTFGRVSGARMVGNELNHHRQPLSIAGHSIIRFHQEPKQNSRQGDQLPQNCLNKCFCITRMIDVICV